MFAFLYHVYLQGLIIIKLASAIHCKHTTFQKGQKKKNPKYK